MERSKRLTIGGNPVYETFNIEELPTNQIIISGTGGDLDGLYQKIGHIDNNGCQDSNFDSDPEQSCEANGPET